MDYEALRLDIKVFNLVIDLYLYVKKEATKFLHFLAVHPEQWL